MNSVFLGASYKLRHLRIHANLNIEAYGEYKICEFFYVREDHILIILSLLLVIHLHVLQSNYRMHV